MCERYACELGRSSLWGLPVRCKVDKREKESPGFKFNEWELKGACIRVELGPRDLESGACPVARRDTGEKQTVALDDLVGSVMRELEDMQGAMYARALDFRNEHTHRVDTWNEFEAAFAGEGGGGLVLAHWDGTQETEDRISEATRATIRAIPLTPLAEGDDQPGACVLTGNPSERRVVFAKAY